MKCYGKIFIVHNQFSVVLWENYTNIRFLYKTNSEFAYILFTSRLDNISIEKYIEIQIE